MCGYTGAHACLTPLVLADLHGLEKLSNAYGLMLSFAAIGVVVGAPLAGVYTDVFHKLLPCSVEKRLCFYPRNMF